MYTKSSDRSEPSEEGEWPTRDRLVDSYRLFIDGEWVEPEGGRYDDISPATEATIAPAPDASTGHVDAAIGAARRAFDYGPWGSATAEERARCLNQLGTRCSSMPMTSRAVPGEWGCIGERAMFQIDGPAFMALHAGELAAEPTEEPLDAYGAAGKAVLRHEPLGVVSILTPWNFPHTLNVMKLAARSPAATRWCSSRRR